MNRNALLKILPPPEGKFERIVDDQTVGDIIGEVLEAHRHFAPDYDRLAGKFDGPDLPRRLWQFCRENLAYDVESEQLQTTRSPAALLSMGACDCKGYAGFIAGVMDAVNRKHKVSGPNWDWRYRFANYDHGDATPGHVFVVMTRPDGSEVWIDPVLDQFDSRYPAPLNYKDKKPADAMGALVRISGTGNTMGDAGTDMAAALKQYELGLAASVSGLVNKSTVDDGTTKILEYAASSLVPGASQALAVAAQVQTVISSTFGPGSVLTRVTNALLNGNPLMAPINLFKALFSGRTYNTDSYLGAWDYYYHVVGHNYGDSTGIGDDMVAAGLQWWITKLGIYISGRAHLGALRQSVDAYMNLYNVNKNTTQDRVRVQLARQVMLNYMQLSPDPRGGLGGWKDTVGVYDNQVTAAIFKQRIQNPAAVTDVSGNVPVSVDVGNTIKNFVTSNPVTTIVIAGGIALLLYEIFTD